VQSIDRRVESGCDAEALALARQPFEAKCVPDALAGGFADSCVADIWTTQAPGLPNGLGRTGLMLKDLRAIDELARAGVAGCP